MPEKPVINYCNTGHQAATNWFVLSEVLRRPDVSLYDGDTRLLSIKRTITVYP